MESTVTLGLVLTATGLATALYAERVGKRSLLYVGKPTASLGFLLVAVGAGALTSSYGLWVFTGLALSMLGDVFLMFDKQVLFLAGLVAFLFGHVAFIAAFLVVGVESVWFWGAIIGAVLSASLVLPWLLPNVETALKAPVLGYVAVISIMLALAFGTRGAGETPLILVGAALFYVSDLFVARERFVSPSFANKAIGLPLYYAGQVLLAVSVIA